jgi:hypothetical protein
LNQRNPNEINVAPPIFSGANHRRSALTVEGAIHWRKRKARTLIFRALLFAPVGFFTGAPLAQAGAEQGLRQQSRRLRKKVLAQAQDAPLRHCVLQVAHSMAQPVPFSVRRAATGDGAFLSSAQAPSPAQPPVAKIGAICPEMAFSGAKTIEFRDLFA